MVDIVKEKATRAAPKNMTTMKTSMTLCASAKVTTRDCFVIPLTRTVTTVDDVYMEERANTIIMTSPAPVNVQMVMGDLLAK